MWLRPGSLGRESRAAAGRAAFQRSWNRRALWVLSRALGLGLAVLPSSAVADETRSSPPAVGLDQLLKIPDAVVIEAPRRRGATRSEWSTRFREARGRKESAESGLDAARKELTELAAQTQTWSIAAPGGVKEQNLDAEGAPLNYRLYQEMRRLREDVERAERLLQELVVEANLAGVPPEWQNPDPD